MGCEQLRMGPVPDPDLQHILVAKLVERNDRVERYLSPRHEGPCRGEKAAVDLLEIGFASGTFGELLPPVVAHRREFPPRLVGGLPPAVLLLVPRTLGRMLESRRLACEAHARQVRHAELHQPATEYAVRAD